MRPGVRADDYGRWPVVGVSQKARKTQKLGSRERLLLGIDTIEGIDLIEGSRERLLFFFGLVGRGVFFSFGRSLSVLCE